MIVGLDRVIRSRVGQRDPACGATIDAPQPTKQCRDVAWVVADAALRTDDARFSRACLLAATACGISSP